MYIHVYYIYTHTGRSMFGGGLWISNLFFFCHASFNALQDRLQSPCAGPLTWQCVPMKLERKSGMASSSSFATRPRAFPWFFILLFVPWKRVRKRVLPSSNVTHDVWCTLQVCSPKPFCWLHWEEIFHSLRQILLRWRKRSWSVADWPASLLPTPCWSAVARWSWWTSLPSAVEIPPRQPAASTVQRHRPRRPRKLRRLAVSVSSCDHFYFVLQCPCECHYFSMFRRNATQECTSKNAQECRRSPGWFSSCLEVVLWLPLIAS